MKGMNRTVVVLGGTALIAFAAVGGASLRDWVDLGRRAEAQMPNFSGVGLVASADANGASYTAGDYFYQLLRLLKREYVEPIPDDQKLASGAIRSMIGSLNDPKAMFFDKKQFASYQNARAGKYEGIGVEVVMVMRGAANKQAVKASDSEGALPEGTAEEALVSRVRVPRLVVSNVIPGSPAEKAGIKMGDVAYEIDNHWVVNTDLLIKFQKAQDDFKAKKITYSQLNLVRKEVRERTERALLPMRAMERLVTGTSGKVKVVWERGTDKRTTDLTKTVTVMNPMTVLPNGDLRLAFKKGADAWLAKEIQGKSKVRIDLRNNAHGDLESLKAVLEKAAPKGTYGQFVTSRGSEPMNLVVSKGNPAAPKYELLVDASTRGIAEMFALALQSKGKATLVGSLTGGDRTLVETVPLPDGSGYVLPIGEYQVNVTNTKVVMAKKAEELR